MTYFISCQLLRGDGVCRRRFSSPAQKAELRSAEKIPALHNGPSGGAWKPPLGGWIEGVSLLLGCSRSSHQLCGSFLDSSNFSPDRPVFSDVYLELSPSSSHPVLGTFSPNSRKRRTDRIKMFPTKRTERRDLQPLPAPSLSPDPPEPLYLVGENVVLRCSLPNTTLQGWRHYQFSRIRENKEEPSTKDLDWHKGDRSLVLTATRENSGSYKCQYLEWKYERNIPSEWSRPVSIVDGVEMTSSNEEPVKRSRDSGVLTLDRSAAFLYAKDNGSLQFVCRYEENMTGRWVMSPWSQTVNITAELVWNKDFDFIWSYARMAIPLIILLVPFAFYCWKKKSTTASPVKVAGGVNDSEATYSNIQDSFTPSSPRATRENRLTQEKTGKTLYYNLETQLKKISEFSSLSVRKLLSNGALSCLFSPFHLLPSLTQQPEHGWEKTPSSSSIRAASPLLYLIREEEEEEEEDVLSWILLEAGVPPSPLLRVDPLSQRVKEGDPLVFLCSTEGGDREKKFHFYKDGVEITSSEEGLLDPSTEPTNPLQNASLRIPHASFNHNGEYACSYEEKRSNRWIMSSWSQGTNITVEPVIDYPLFHSMCLWLHYGDSWFRMSNSDDQYKSGQEDGQPELLRSGSPLLQREGLWCGEGGRGAKLCLELEGTGLTQEKLQLFVSLWKEEESDGGRDQLPRNPEEKMETIPWMTVLLWMNLGADSPPPPVLKLDPSSQRVKEGDCLFLLCLAEGSITEKKFHFYKDGEEITSSQECLPKNSSESEDLLQSKLNVGIMYCLSLRFPKTLRPPVANVQDFSTHGPTRKNHLIKEEEEILYYNLEFQARNEQQNYPRLQHNMAFLVLSLTRPRHGHDLCMEIFLFLSDEQNAHHSHSLHSNEAFSSWPKGTELIFTEVQKLPATVTLSAVD
ncbi:hypothetical protein L345_09763, partial [Ophiophagus hannah]